MYNSRVMWYDRLINITEENIMQHTVYSQRKLGQLRLIRATILTVLVLGAFLYVAHSVAQAVNSFEQKLEQRVAVTK